MSTAIGRRAEALVASYLENRGGRILARNWRTRWCEIDMVVSKGGTIYFVEVKYRRRSEWGSGLDYITPRKLQQMGFAAKFWSAKHQTTANLCLGAVEVTGANTIRWLALT